MTTAALDLTRPFWDAAAREVLAIEHCATCDRFIHFPLPACPQCHRSDTLGWRPVSGRGTLYSFVVVHRTRFPGFAARLPYVVGCVELEEQAGLRLFAQVVDCDPARVQVGDAVAVTFERRPELVVPQFRPARPAPPGPQG